MNLSFFIARRYLFSKKSTNVINVISGVSVAGVAIATMAMVIVMSVFNGFHDLVASFFTAFDPQIKVVPTKGKSVAADDTLLLQMRRLPQVEVATECVEDMALAYYQGKQAMVTVKGVDENFDSLTHIREILVGDGSYELSAGNLDMGIPGIRLAIQLGIGARWKGFLRVYAPVREGQLADLSAPDEGFVVDSLFSAGVVFSVKQAKYDKDYIITPISFARRLFSRQGEISSLEFRLKQGSDLDGVKKEMRRIGQGRFKVMDRYEQQDDTFSIMQIEKTLAYAFLCFILVIACFNIVGSLSMLIVDKKADIATMRNIGATNGLITRIFLYEGRLISAIGAVAGILIGLLLCWLQQRYGIVSMGQSDGTFVVNAYPVSVHYTDIAVVFFTVIVVGWLSAWYPVHYFARRIYEKGGSAGSATPSHSGTSAKA